MKKSYYSIGRTGRTRTHRQMCTHLDLTDLRSTAGGVSGNAKPFDRAQTNKAYIYIDAQVISMQIGYICNAYVAEKMFWRCNTLFVESL